VERAAGLPGDRALLDRAVEIEGSVQDLSASDGARFALAAALREDGRFAEARVIFRSLLDEVRERGDELDVTNMLLNLYELEYAAGDWDASLAYAREMYEFDVQVGYPSVIPLSTIAMIEGHRGAFDHARTHVREALASVQTHAAQLHGIRELDALIAAGTVELAAGDVAAAVGPLAEASATFLGSAWGSSVGGWFLADVAEALIGCDRAAEVQPLTTWLEEKAPALSDATALALVARIRGLVAASKGDPGQAIRELERAVEHHERVEVPFERARTLLALGTVRRHAKQKAAAREALQQAESVFERLGATPWADRARQELAAIGGRAPSTGRLTPTEDRVARLAAVGRTNREIANALFLSVRTVEGHLSHIYAKLGVRSRTELAVVLTPDSETT
jgi:DNA-binding CsgD family transcriptional regulator